MSGLPYTTNAFTFYSSFKKQYVFRYMSGLDVIVVWWLVDYRCDTCFSQRTASIYTRQLKNSCEHYYTLLEKVLNRLLPLLAVHTLCAAVFM